MTDKIDETGRVISFVASAGFAKGTLVHAKDGFLPIEKIAVGDLVLSRPEGGSAEVTYKRVTRWFEHAPTVVLDLRYRFENEQKKYSTIRTTLNHPFGVVGASWTSVVDLDLRVHRIALFDGRQAMPIQRCFVFKTRNPAVGWYSHRGNLSNEIGYEWDFEGNFLLRDQVYADDDVRFDGFDYPYELAPNHPSLYVAPVFGIEVEDFRTYFVGKDGLWVHCNGEGAVKNRL